MQLGTPELVILGLLAWLGMAALWVRAQRSKGDDDRRGRG
jgi:hypothetical protein